MSMIFSAVKDQSLTLEVEQWLEAQKIKEAQKIEGDVDQLPSGYIELPAGFTKFKDGVIPVSRNQDIKTEAERQKITEEKNKQVREAKQYQAELKAKLRVDQLQEQNEILGKFFEKASLSDTARLCEMVGITKKTLWNARSGANAMNSARWAVLKSVILSFSFKSKEPIKVLVKPAATRRKPKQAKVVSEETKRRSLRIKLTKEAREKGLSVFNAPCAKHGMTPHRFHKKTNTSRCIECRTNIKRDLSDLTCDQVRMSFDERTNHNRKQMKDAMQLGEKRFTGLCMYHGHTEFIYYYVTRQQDYGYRCVLCRKNGDKNYRVKKLQVSA